MVALYIKKLKLFLFTEMLIHCLIRPRETETYLNDCTYIDFLSLGSKWFVKVFMLPDQSFHSIKGIPQVVIS